MSNHIGSSTVYTSILPNNAALGRINNVTLSRLAKHRLHILEYYFKTGNASLTCRHFGIARSYLYKWLRRYNPKYLHSLESLSCRPKNLRPATYDHRLVRLIRKLRTDYPSYSANKLAIILLRDYAITYSAATIGRIIKKYGLYFSALFKAAKLRSRKAYAVWKKRKPYDLKASGPKQLIEFDMKHIYTSGQKHYAFLAIDVFTRQLVVHIANRPSSFQAMLALKQAIEVFGKDVSVVNDNGSENLKQAYDYLKTEGVTQYFTRPHRPKDKPHVENVIGKLQQECLDEDRSRKTIDELKAVVTRWVNDYHFFRPHQALNYMTPEEFCATLNITIPRAEVSTR